jgi:hypothetical protein
MGIHASLHEQICMRALLYHASLVQNNDQVSVPYGGEPMRNQQCRTPSHEAFECFMDETLVLGIQM